MGIFFRRREPTLLESIAQPALQAVDLSERLGVEAGFTICRDELGQIKTGNVVAGARKSIRLPSCQTEPGDQAVGDFHAHEDYAGPTAGDYQHLLSMAFRDEMAGRRRDEFYQCFAGLKVGQASCWRFTPDEELRAKFHRVAAQRRTGSRDVPEQFAGVELKMREVERKSLAELQELIRR